MRGADARAEGGCRDELVTRSDSVDDLLRSETYVYRTVINADHRSILRPTQYDDRYVIHGIRDLGRTWTPQICEAIRATAAQDKSRAIRTIRSSYGYFSMLSFLLAPDRQKNVRWFMDLSTQMMARYPAAAHHYVGHSNGTYILVSALKRSATCKVKNVVFAGSVVPSAFDWTRYTESGQVSYVRNDAATADWVVAIFPHLFELFASALAQFNISSPKWLDLGAAGFNGFYDDSARDHTWLPGQHDAALNVFGRDEDPVPPVLGRQNRLVGYLSKFAWLVLPVVAAIFVGISFAWHHNPILGAVLTLVLFSILFTV